MAERGNLGALISTAAPVTAGLAEVERLEEIVLLDRPFRPYHVILAPAPIDASRANIAAEQMSAGLRAYQSAGVDHVVLALNTGDMARIRALMEDIARKVMPQFR